MKNKKIYAALLATSLIFAGCSNENNKTVEPTPTQTQQVDPNEKATTENTNGTATENASETATTNVTDDDNTKDHSKTPEVGITMYEAIDKMAEHFGLESIGIESVELDEDNGFYKYEIDGYLDGTEYDASIDANTGEILSSEADGDDDHDEVIDINNIISPEEAMEAALDGQEGAYVYEWDLSIDDGKTKYEIDVENGSDKEVDALTGEVYDD